MSWISGGTRARFPSGDDEVGYLFFVQRIPALSEPIRTALIQRYFPLQYQEAAIKDRENEACLVRPYLGQRRSDREMRNPQDTLQNFPLYLDQLEDIGLDIKQYAIEMALGLAAVHWGACLDGMDMEFVIGSTSPTLEQSPIPVIPNFQNIKPFSIPAGNINLRRRPTHLWVLDFDKAEELDYIDKWDESRAKLVTAVTANDPYFPNPSSDGSTEGDIWGVFEATYMEAGMVILGQRKDYKRMKNYPQEFIRDWKIRARELKDDEEGAFITFGE